MLKAQPLDSGVIDKYLANHELSAKGYLVAVGRFVEEKGFHDLIDAYAKSGLSLPLVLVGDTDHETVYSSELKAKARNTKGVKLTGFVKGDELKVLFSQAKVFVMPSYHEGLPIALLEAMSFSLPAIVSDIPANTEVGLNEQSYFPVGDVNSLASKLANLPEQAEVDYATYLEKYDWEKIAAQTVEVYKKALS